MIGKNIAANTTWCNFGIPYLIKVDDIDIYNGSSPYPTVTFTINPGTTIKFDPDLGLYLGHAFTGTVQCGVLNAVGTKEQPITFTTSSPGQYWSGILFKWGTSSQSRLNYCTIEYAGAHFAELEDNIEHDAAVSFWESSPSAETIKNSTVRYSKADGIKIHSNDSGSATIKNCNIYSNDLYDFIDFQNNQNINAQLNYWGTPYGPSQDLCSSAIVTGTVVYEPWLEEEFSDPFRFISAGANPKQFNPITGNTTFSFTLSQPANWTLSILNQQFEKVWSKSGLNSPGGTITWNGMGENGVVSGVCYYRIEAESNGSTASPVMGILNLGDQTIARITQPLSHTLFTSGTEISIEGTAITNGGYYEVKYGMGGAPTSWNTITGPIYSSKQNEQLATWDTTGLNQPVYTIRLDVINSGITYSDLVTVDFLVEETQPPPDAAIAYTYDSHGRLSGITYPDGSSIRYTYDRTGNRLTVTRDGQLPPTVVHLAYFRAEPTPQGVLLQWKTESEINTVGFNLYRRIADEKDYTKINNSLIPAKGSSISGVEYSFLDVPPQQGGIYFYLLEDVDTAGNTKRYGPVSSKNITQRNRSGKGVFRKSLSKDCN
ncbi:MAG: RHS repeat protein [Proteobacteria bacterium]|nr:RHS repeat protein [Pseudomonadota bacterium]